MAVVCDINHACTCVGMIFYVRLCLCNLLYSQGDAAEVYIITAAGVEKHMVDLKKD